MRSPIIGLLAAAAALSGCALFQPETSWVDDVPDRDTVQLSKHIADVAASRWMPGDRVRLAALRGNAASEALVTQMTAALQARGFTVVEKSGDAHALRYFVSRYGNGLLLRMRLDDAEATTVLSRAKNGELITGVPLTLRKGASL